MVFYMGVLEDGLPSHPQLFPFYPDPPAEEKSEKTFRTGKTVQPVQHIQPGKGDYRPDAEG